MVVLGEQIRQIRRGCLLIVLASCSAEPQPLPPEVAGGGDPWLRYETSYRSPALPVVSIDAYGLGTFIPRDKIRARMKVGGVDTPIGISLRGSSSAGAAFYQKSYSVELRDDLNEARKLPILDMPAGEDWALVACWTDKPCMRNALAYAIGRQLGRWNPKLRFVELVLDGHYDGIYQLVEPIRQDKRRVNIPKAGGFIIRREAAGKATPTTRPPRDWLSAPSGMVYTYHYPKEDKITDGQRAYIADHLARFEQMMLAPDWRERYSDWIDITSFVDFVLMNELTNNVDAYFKSVYITKEAEWNGGKLALTPLWDFNIAFGNANYRDGWNFDNRTREANRWGGVCTSFLPPPAGCPVCITSEAQADTTCWNLPYVPFWMNQLWTDPTYVDDMKCRWLELRKGPLDVEQIAMQLEAWRHELRPAMNRHFARWNRLLTYNWPNWYVGSSAGDMNAFFDEEVDYLRNWTANRIRALDRNLPGTCRKN